MSKVAFKMHHTNPNPRGGCLCSPASKIQSCKPPYFVASNAELYDPRQPHAVICLACADGCRRKARNKDPLVTPPKAQPVPAAEVNHALGAASTAELVAELSTRPV